MDYMIFGITLCTVLILIIPGVLVKHFKTYWLISGYNTMSKEKKKNVDIEGLSKLVGNFCFGLAALILIAGVLMMAGKSLAAGIASALIVPASIYMLITAQKYDGNTRNPDGTMNTKTKVIIGSISAFLVITLIGVGVLIYQSNKPSEFVVADGYLEIKGMYGEKINVKDIEEVVLKDSLPEITYKSNGSALGNKMKGNFKLKDIGDAKLFLDTSKPPFIYVVRNGKTIILNCDSAEETTELFDLLIKEYEDIGL